jgi:TolA-binding protein
MMRKQLVSWAVLAVALCGAVPAFAQSDVEGRVGRLESEMRAVQRKVFPGGGGQYVEPQIQPQATTGPDGLPATSPVADLATRVNTLEGRVSSLTGEIETTDHRVQVLETDFAAYKRATDARLKALEGAGPVSTPPDGDLAPPRATPPRDTAAPKPGPSKITPPAKPSAKPDAVLPPTTDPVRQKKIAAIERPQTDDAGEDAYIYGYRLWQAKLYPEAEAQFKTVTTTYPKHKRASFAQNLLGRSYLEDGKPSLASLAFYDNYKKWPDGDRAPESLYYLAQALGKLGKPAADVCKVYRELTDVYGAKISDVMKADIARGRTASKCS